MSPWLLWGLALAGVPILIQWLHRRNYTQRVWGAMRFLQAATKAQSRRLRFESLLLLAIRALILLLTAVALAEPFLESAGWLPTAPSSVHRLLVIDTSLSMQYAADGRSVGDLAQEAARHLVVEAMPGDSFQIVTIGQEGEALIRRPAYDAVEVLAEIDQLTWTEEFGDPLASLSLARQVLKESSSTGRVELIIISDFQRTNWLPERTAERTRLQRVLAELAGESELSLIRVGDEEAANVATSEARIEPLPVTLGASVEVSCETTNYGASERRASSDSGIPVELVESDRVLQTKSIIVPTNGSRTATFSTRWREAGWHGLEVRVPPDGLAADDHRWLAANVRDEVHVLLVNGRESSESLGRASDYVELALAALARSERSTSGAEGMSYRPIVVSEAEFARTELAPFDCVVLCDVPFLSEAELLRLRTFVRGGGGLVIGVGPQVQLDAYNQWLTDGQDGLLPLSLLQVVGSDDPDAVPFHFEEPSPNGSPIVEPFVGNPQAGLTTANIYRYVRTELRNADSSRRARDVSPPMQADDSRMSTMPGSSPVRVALAFDNGDPAIVEHDFGAGRVLLITTSLDDRWGSWALWPSFLPMMHRIIDYATAGDATASLLVGDVLSREYPVQTVGLTATLQYPDGRRRPGRTRMVDGATQATFDAVEQSGLYRLLLGPPLNRAEWIAVNVDARESDLAILNENELQQTLLGGIEARLASGAAPVEGVRAATVAPSRLTRWLLMVAFVLLLVEQVMAWNARLGLICLAAGPFILLIFALWPTATVLGLAAVLVGVVAAKRYQAWT